MNIWNYIDGEKNEMPVNYFEELNDYISNLYNEFLMEKNELINFKNINGDKLEKIEIDFITNRIEILQKRIDDIEKLNYNIKLTRYKDYLDNCQEGEKVKIQILRSQEFERKRIARDLHDTVIQNLTGLIHKAEIALKVIDTDSVRAKLEIFSISNNIKEVINEMRNIIYGLRPMAFDDIGIDVIIERELLRFKENGIKVNYSVEGESRHIEQTILLTILRIIQEACSNAIKHSKATKINIDLTFNEEVIELIIEDNGIGFDAKDSSEIDIDTKSGFGLSMMRERVYLLSGNISIDSKEDKGTKIRVIVPNAFREEK